MKLVDLKQIPRETQDVPLDNLMEVYLICQKMQKICLEKNGIGLAAVQVGIPWKLFIYWNNYPNRPESFSYILNSFYEPSNVSTLQSSVESCLSIKNIDDSSRYFKLNRYDSILVRGQILKCESEKPYLEQFEKKIEKDLFCVLFQHEIDHQDGKLISENGEEIYLQKL
jgi:peptide deformylase